MSASNVDRDVTSCQHPSPQLGLSCEYPPGHDGPHGHDLFRWDRHEIPCGAPSPIPGQVCSQSWAHAGCHTAAGLAWHVVPRGLETALRKQLEAPPEPPGFPVKLVLGLMLYMWTCGYLAARPKRPAGG